MEEKENKESQNKIQTFPHLSKRKSVYKLFVKENDSVKEAQIKDIESINIMIKDLDKKKFGKFKKQRFGQYSPKKIPKINTALGKEIAQEKVYPKSKRDGIAMGLPTESSIHSFPSLNTKTGHTVYSKNFITVEPSPKTDFDIKLIEGFQKDQYYSRLQGEKYGCIKRKFNPIYQKCTYANKEEYIMYNGISDSNYNVKSLFFQKKFKNKNLRIKNISDIEFKLIQEAHNRIKPKKRFLDSKHERDLPPNYFKNKFYEDSCNEILRTKYDVSSFTKQEEFTKILVKNFLSISGVNLNVCKDKTKRKIFVIQSGTVLTNPNLVIGIIAQIPTKQELEKLSITKREKIFEDFLFFCSKKFKKERKFLYAFSNQGKGIFDLIDIPKESQYIFVSSNQLFQGLSIPLNKNNISIYKKFFGKETEDIGAFTTSSDEEENSSEESYQKLDDIYDIYFKKRQKIAKFKVWKKKKEIYHHNKSFTEGIINEESLDYFYYSDNERRKIKIDKEILSNKGQKKLDYFITAQNSLYDEKIKNLLSGLSDKKHSIAPNKSDSELMEEFLKKKNMLSQYKRDWSSPITVADLVDALKILKQKDPTINVSKFYEKRNGEKDIPPYVLQNKQIIENKYAINRRKTEIQYPALLCNNIPAILSEHPKYSRVEVISLFAKFKSLVNLWFNLHNDTKIRQYGIDFEVFHNCTEVSQEERVLAKKIYEGMNKGTTGILSLSDFIDGMILMNKQELKEQMNFFLNVFDNTGRGKFCFKEVFTICQMSVKRLLTNFKGTPNEMEIVNDIAQFFAKFIYQLVETDPNEFLLISKLKDIINNNTKDLEYLEVFCCTYKK